jgi:ATP-dependent DNA helicase RecG
MIRESRGRSDAALAELPSQKIANALGAVKANYEVSSIRVLGLLLFGREDAIKSLSSHS